MMVCTGRFTPANSKCVPRACALGAKTGRQNAPLFLRKNQECAAGVENFDWVSAAKAMLRDCKAHPKTIYHVFNSLSRDQLEQYVFTSTDDVFYHLICLRASGRQMEEADLKCISSFCRYAFIGFFVQFLWNRMEDDIDESVDRLSVFFEDFADSALRRCARPEA